MTPFIISGLNAGAIQTNHPVNNPGFNFLLPPFFKKRCTSDHPTSLV
jgi:hypothetical protein